MDKAKRNDAIRQAIELIIEHLPDDFDYELEICVAKTQLDPVKEDKQEETITEVNAKILELGNGNFVIDSLMKITQLTKNELIEQF